MLPAKAKKKRGVPDAHLNLKRVKLENSTSHPHGIQFETTLSPPIQEALSKFREASEQELIRLRREGMDSSAAINKLVEKMRSTEKDDDGEHASHPPSFTRQELELVMEIAGVNEEGATRALILRSELAKLRHDGFNHPEAINELSRRMKRLVGSKRRGMPSVDRRDSHKHRRRGSTPASPFSSLLDPTTNTNTTTTTTTSTTTATTPIQTPATRKRIQDVLMMDDEQYALLRKRPKYDLSDSSDSSDEDDGEADKYYFGSGSGEFSQDEKEGDDEGEFSIAAGRRRRTRTTRNEEAGDSEDVKSPEDIIPLVAPFDYSVSSSDEDGFHILNHFKDSTPNELESGEGMDDVDISGWSESILFHPVATTDEEDEAEEGEDDDEDDDEGEDSDDSWRATTTTTTTTTNTNTTTTSTHPSATPSHLPPLFPSSSSLTTPTNPAHSSNSSNHNIPSRTRTRAPPSTKRRDGNSPSPHSSRVVSQRSIS